MVSRFFNSVLPCDSEVAGWWTNLVMAYWYDFAIFLTKPDRLQAVNEARVKLLGRLVTVMRANNRSDARINLQCQVTDAFARVDLRYQQAVLIPCEHATSKLPCSFRLVEQIMRLRCDAYNQAYHLTLKPTEKP